jgi:hypothetical protein
MTATPTLTGKKTTKVKRPKEGGICVILFYFWVLFCGRFFFPLYVSIKLKKFFIIKNLIITYKLSTIEGFYHKVNDFATGLIFLNFFHSFKK